MALTYLESAPSTNGWARERLPGLSVGDGCYTFYQTEGRGRRGKPWLSPPGAGLALSVIVTNRPGLPLMIGLAALEALGDERLMLKWPNDFVAEGKKLGGILCERRGGNAAAIAGIGINLTQTEGQLAALGLPHATSLAMLKIEADADKLAADIVQALLRMDSQPFVDYKEYYQSHCVNMGRQVVTDTGLSGVAAGVDDAGDLLIQTAGGIVPVAAGEVSIRGVYGYV